MIYFTLAIVCLLCLLFPKCADSAQEEWDWEETDAFLEKLKKDICSSDKSSISASSAGIESSNSGFVEQYIGNTSIKSIRIKNSDVLDLTPDEQLFTNKRRNNQGEFPWDAIHQAKFNSFYWREPCQQATLLTYKDCIIINCVATNILTRHSNFTFKYDKYPETKFHGDFLRCDCTCKGSTVKKFALHPHEGNEYFIFSRTESMYRTLKMQGRVTIHLNN